MTEKLLTFYQLFLYKLLFIYNSEMFPKPSSLSLGPLATCRLLRSTLQLARGHNGSIETSHSQLQLVPLSSFSVAWTVRFHHSDSSVQDVGPSFLG